MSNTITVANDVRVVSTITTSGTGHTFYSKPLSSWPNFRGIYIVNLWFSVLCRPLCVLLFFFFWLLYCLFFDWRIPIITLNDASPFLSISLLKHCYYESSRRYWRYQREVTRIGVNRGITDNTMAKGKGTKRQTTIYETYIQN